MQPETLNLETLARDAGLDAADLRRLLMFRCVSEHLAPQICQQIYAQGLFDTALPMKGLSASQLAQRVTELLKSSRVDHVMGCTDTAVALAEKHGANVRDAERAALLHDITKALDGPLQLTLCREYGTMLDTFSTKNPKTLHAITGSLVAERIFGENPDVVSAIRWHTTGKADMNLLEKIIYVADYMEPNRDFPGVERLRELAFKDISAALKMGLEMTVNMLQQQGREVSPESREAIAYLEQNGV